MSRDADLSRVPDADAPSDAELLSRGASGDGAAFGVLVRRHLRNATAVALEIAGNLEDAEDIVQEAFLVTLDRASTFDVARRFAPWLYGIVRHKAIRLRARAARRRRLLWLFGWPEPTAAEEDRVDASATLVRARALLEALPEMQRRCFDLHVGLGLPTPVVAERCGIAESTVRQHVFRARATLRRALGDGERP
jgi:RNA polymerase sigma-70 factor, ECF subfamily